MDISRKNMEIFKIMGVIDWDIASFQVLSAHADDYKSGWGGNKLIRNDFSRLYLLMEGEAMVRTEDGPWFDMRPGKLYLIPGGQIRRYYKCPKSMHLMWIHFRLEAVPGISVFSRYNPPFSIPVVSETPERFHRIIQIKKDNSPRSHLQMVADLSLLLAPFMPESWEVMFPEGGNLEKLKPAMTMIQQNLNHHPKLDELAKAVSLHPTYFSYLFKRTFGVTPLQFHKKQLMNRACALLHDHNHSVGEVAYSCGFEDPLYFSRIFKEYVGVNPTTYRKSGTLRLP